jgi:threonine/homoserine efflux transporter RhtA
VLFALAALAVVCTALAFIVFFALIREVGPARALVFTYINPAVALAAGVIVLGEPLTRWNFAGLALVLTGCVLATRRVEQAAAAPFAVEPTQASPNVTPGRRSAQSQRAGSRISNTGGCS